MFFIVNCFPDECDAWVIIVFAYFGILQITALVLALLTRGVKIKVLNESKEISAIIYILTILVMEMFVFAILLGSNNDLQEGLFNSHMALAAIVVLSFLFIPKVCILITL